MLRRRIISRYRTAFVSAEKVSRRRMLAMSGLAAGAVAGGSGALAWLADRLSGTAIAEGEPALLRFGGAPQQLATPIELFDRLITPTKAFFVRSHFATPALLPQRKLVLDGMVKTPLTLTVDDLRAMPSTTLTAVLQCAGNGRALHAPRVPGVQWVHGAMGQATWKGVRLRDLLAKAGVADDAAHVRLDGADLPPKPQTPAFIRSIPMTRAMAADTLVAYEMNGEPLTLAHGAPLRLIVPGWAGDHWIKWLTGVRAQKAEADGFYMQTAYKMPIEPVAPGAAVPPEKMASATTFPVKSLIARPADGGRSPVGQQEIVGVAFAGNGAIKKVEVSIDDGKTWRAATLEGEPGVGRWQVFRWKFEQKTAGQMRAVARATDTSGVTQPETAAWNPSGYFWNAWHRVAWEVVG